MRKTYMYRLYPTKHQQKSLIQTLELCRYVYNETLSTRKNAWEQEKKNISLYDTNSLLPLWKEKKPELKNAYSQVLQEVQVRVDLAFKSFFCRVKAGSKPGYPRFKGIGRYNSFAFKQAGFSIKDNTLSLSKIGKIKIVLHRPIRGKIKTLTIRKNSVGKWYACFSCEVEPNLLPVSKKAIGIDVGLSKFATFSNGKSIDNPRFFVKEQKELAKAQRKLSKANNGSPEREKRKKTVQYIHKRISNKRKDFSHKISHKIVNEYGIIALEKLNTKKMLKTPWLAKSISDVAWNQFIQFIQYKAENAGRECVLVDPRNTSKMCSRCGTLVEKDLSVRIHSCPICGLKMDRDKNAAINILALGLDSLGKTRKSSANLLARE